MVAMQLHPNTQVVLDAWKRLTEGQMASEGPATDDDPGLVANLFVLNHVGEDDFAFRRAGNALERLFGRQLIDYNFLSIWNEGDRGLVAAGLAVALRDRGPLLIRARGETLAGRRIDIEFALAPILRDAGASNRLLGLCQSTTPEEILHGRPLRRLQAQAIYPPAPPAEAIIRVVSSN
jgi:hypothetical protein